MEGALFDVGIKKAGIGHSAASHKETRRLQSLNHDDYHHPQEKIAQLEAIKDFVKGDILEVFAGQGNLTKFYQQHGNVIPLNKAETGDSFQYIYKLRYERKRFDVIDIDSYGYPDKFFPVVFEMLKPDSLLVITFPIVGTNCVNGIVEQHFINFWRSARPTIGDITGILTDFALRDYGVLSLESVVKIKRIWRLAYRYRKEKATTMCNVRNR